MGLCASAPVPGVPDDVDVESKEDDEFEYGLTFNRHNSSYANLYPLQRHTRVEDTYDVTEHKLGEGSTGCVVIATHKKTGARRALKNIDLSRVNPKYVERLRGEIAILKQLDHPNVVKLYETYEYNNTIYMVMEHCRGGELYSRLVDLERYQEDHARKIVSQILGAISYCHSKGIAHRDVKLANFVFKDKEHYSPIKLIDFGFSAMHSTTESTFSTFVGSAYYMAPEVIAKDQYTLQCDMWGIGVVSYTLIAGHPPFMGKTEASIAKKIQNNNPPFRSRKSGKIWKGASPESKAFITDLLQRDPQKRLTADQAMKHPWILMMKRPKVDLSTEAIFALRRFSNYTKLKQIGLVVMAHFADRDEVTAVMKIFVALDNDSSGRIELDEMVVELVRYGISEEEAKAIFLSIDQDGSGAIRFSEFLAPMLEDHVSTKEICTEIFSLMDSEKRGYITRDYFVRWVDGLVDKEMVDKIMTEADSDGDGKIDAEEFFKAMFGDRTGRPKSPRLTSLVQPPSNPLAKRRKSTALIAVHYSDSLSLGSSGNSTRRSSLPDDWADTKKTEAVDVSAVDIFDGGMEEAPPMHIGPSAEQASLSGLVVVALALQRQKGEGDELHLPQEAPLRLLHAYVCSARPPAKSKPQPF